MCVRDIGRLCGRGDDGRRMYVVCDLNSGEMGASLRCRHADIQDREWKGIIRMNERGFGGEEDVPKIEYRCAVRCEAVRCGGLVSWPFRCGMRNRRGL